MKNLESRKPRKGRVFRETYPPHSINGVQEVAGSNLSPRLPFPRSLPQKPFGQLARGFFYFDSCVSCTSAVQSNCGLAQSFFLFLHGLAYDAVR
jgi:hypothetical protein